MLLEAIGVTLLVLLWIGTVSIFAQLPDLILTHYNAAGRADAFRNKATIFIAPTVATLIYLDMTLLNMHPHLYNYLTTVTSENARRLYTSMKRFIKFLKLGIVLIFCGIVVMTYRTIVSNGRDLGRWFLPTAIALLVLPASFSSALLLRKKLQRSKRRHRTWCYGFWSF